VTAPPLSVAVVIPCHNGASYLADALASVRAQSRPVREVIVVDDASADRSPRIAEEQGARCIRLERGVGAAAARNVGVRAAAGADVVAFLDADDLWEPHHTATLAPLLERAPDAALAFARMRRFGAATGTLARPGGDGVPFDARSLLLGWNFVPQSGALVRRDAFLAVGGYHEDPARWFVEDYALWLRLAERHPFVASPEVTLLYRTHPGQSSRDVARMVDGEWAVRDRHLGAIAATDPPRAAAVRRQLLRVWRAELRQAWRRRDRPLFTARLAAAPWVPDAAATARRWTAAARVAGRWWLERERQR
jgi:glycosyltransferase involved in cell wall biosynthesis